MTAVVLGLFCLLIGGGFVGLVVWVATNNTKRVKARQDGMAAFAAQHEWTYVPEDPSLTVRFVGSPFGHGSSQRARNVLLGTQRGRPFTAFDYSYVTTSTDSEGHSSSSTHTYSVVAMALGVAVPNLSVAPQGGVGRFFGKLFGTDLQLGDKPFDDRYAVSADDPRFAADVLHPAMRQMLMTWGDLAWRLSGDSLLVIRSGAHAPAEVDAKLAAMDALLAQVPAQVWANLGVEPPR